MAVSVIAAIGLAISAAGTAAQIVGQKQQTSALKKAEGARQQQLTLDTVRKNREAVRQSYAARALALSNASNQGAQGGSGLPGGYGQIAGETNSTVLANNQNQQLGNQIFSANQDYYSASGITNAGVGLASLGGAVMNNAGAIARIGAGFGTTNPTATANRRFGNNGSWYS